MPRWRWRLETRLGCGAGGAGSACRAGGRPGTRAAEALQLLSSGIFDPRKVLSGSFELPDIAAAMVENRDDKANAIKMVMVNPACKW